MSNKAKFYKHPAFGVVFGYPISTPPGRLVWPKLSEPGDGYEYKGKDIEGKYEGTILLDAEDKEVKDFIQEVKEAVEVMQTMFNSPTKSGGKKKKQARTEVDPDEIFTLAEDEDWVDLEKYPYYKGKIILKATNKNQPLAVDSDGEGEYSIEDFEGGMVVVFSVTPIFSSAGVSFRLVIVQFVEDDGKRFGGGGMNLKKIAKEILVDRSKGKKKKKEVEEDEEENEEESEESGKGEEDEADEGDVEEEDSDDDDSEEDSSEVDDSADDETEDSEEEDDSDDEESDNAEDSESEESDDVEDDSSEDEDSDDSEEEEAPKKKSPNGKKKSLTAADIRARNIAAQKAKLQAKAKAKGGKKAAIDRL